MGLHIDFIENDWSAGQQRKVASLEIVDDVPTLTAPADLDKWLRVFEVKTLPNKVAYGEAEPLLAKVSKRFQGDYVFATDPHDAAECDVPKFAYLQAPGQPAATEKKTAATH